MKKLDLKKEYAALFKAIAKPSSVKVPKLRYLMIDGQGDPGTSKDYMYAITTLYGLSYTLKFTIKNGPEAIDYGVMPLESLWWADDMRDFERAKRDNWKWTAMIMQPAFITATTLKAAKAELARKKKDLPAMAKVRLEELTEGMCMQVMHTGPWANEHPAIMGLHASIADREKAPRGKHHEIYLSDPRRTAPEKLRTILRQPMG